MKESDDISSDEDCHYMQKLGLHSLELGESGSIQDGTCYYRLDNTDNPMQRNCIFC